MKLSRVILIVFLISLIIWIANTLIDYFLLKDSGFLELLITAVPNNVLCFRIFLITIVIISGILLYYDVWNPKKITTVEIEYRDENTSKDKEGSDILKKFFHELKTQLNNIVGFTNLLYDENTSADTAKTYFKYLESSKSSLASSVGCLIDAIKKLKKDDFVRIDKEDYSQLDWRSKTILIAEDVESNYIMLETLLEKTGAKILRAENGRIAIDIFKNNPEIDLILMDILMPEMDGWEAAREIKKINSKIPIIAQTAFAIQSKDEMKEFNDILIKPIWDYDLFRKCSSYLS